MELLTPALATGYYHYTGSLTTPPCTEGVDWNLAKGALGVCQAQVDRLKAGIASVQEGVDINNRAVQELHQRDVTMTPPQAMPNLLVRGELAAPRRRRLLAAVGAAGSCSLPSPSVRWRWAASSSASVDPGGIKLDVGGEDDHVYVPWYARGSAA